MSLDGQQLGHYRLQRLIGSGSMGEVYLAEDSRLPRQVAIKVVRNEVSNYPRSESVSDAARLFLTNLIAVVAMNNTFNLYVNSAHVATAVDLNSSYSYGQIGLIADSFDTPTEVAFTNAKVWTL